MKRLPPYKTTTLSRYGRFLLLTLAAVALGGYLFLPRFEWPDTRRQLFTLNGNHLKYNDEAVLRHFFASIKNNKGYLCLGTSESTTLPEGNYYDFLNNDSSVDVSFSVLSGAGKTCGLYAPIFIQNAAAVKGLRLVYFINPVYWRTDLSTLNKDYWNRYSNYAMCTAADWGNPQNKPYAHDVERYGDVLNPFEKTVQTLEYHIREVRKRFFMDLAYTLDPSAYEKGLTYINTEKSGLHVYPHVGKIDTEHIDTVWNIDRSFHHAEWFKPVDEQENYRYRELTDFVRLCQTLGIEAHFIIGPYNERFIQNQDPGNLAGYRHVTEGIRTVLIREKANYIDATDISNLPGTFVDHQHHSSYGAYLIYQKLKQHLYEKTTP